MELEQLLSSRRNEPDPFPTQPLQNYNVLGCGYDPEKELPAMRVHASFLGVWEWGAVHRARRGRGKRWCLAGGPAIGLRGSASARFSKCRGHRTLSASID